MNGKINSYHIKIKKSSLSKKGIFNINLEKKKNEIHKNFILFENVKINSNFDKLIFLDFQKNEKFLNKNSFLKIKIDEKKIFSDNKKILDIENDLWVVPLLENGNKHILKKNDFFKIGKKIIKICYINIDSEKSEILTRENTLNDENSVFLENYQILKKEEKNFEKKNLKNDFCKNEKICRICLDFENLEKKFVKEICKCSEKLPIHYFCLIEWFKKKCKIEKEKKIMNFDFSKLFCDICKEKIEIKNKEKKKYFNFKKNIFGQFENFLIMEIFDIKGILENIYFIPFEFKNQKFFLGGYKNKTISFKNVYSKSIAEIQFFQNNFYLNFLKNNSKYEILKRTDEILKIENFENRKFFFGNFFFKICKIKNKKKCKCGIKIKKMEFIVTEKKRKNSNEENIDQNINLKNNIHLLRKKSINLKKLKNFENEKIFQKKKILEKEIIFQKEKKINLKKIKKKCFFKYNTKLSKIKKEHFFKNEESIFFSENQNNSQFFNF